MAARHISRQKTLGETARQNTAHVHTSTWSNLSGQRVTDRKKAKKRHLTEGMTHKTLTDLTILTVSGQVEARLIVNVHLQHTTNVYDRQTNCMIFFYGTVNAFCLCCR